MNTEAAWKRIGTGAILAVVLATTVFIVQSAEGQSTTFQQKLNEELPTILQQASAAQADAIEDGVVSREEYDSALASFLDCAKKQGVNILEVDRDGSGLVWSLRFHGGLTSADAEKADALVSDCRLEHFQYVDYVRQVTLDPNGNAQTVATRVLGCLQSFGVTIDETPRSAAELHDLLGINTVNPKVSLDVYNTCWRTAQVP